jgi:ABC-type transport system involved in cytochrome c biogenesis permease component
MIIIGVILFFCAIISVGVFWADYAQSNMKWYQGLFWLLVYILSSCVISPLLIGIALYKIISQK